MDYVTLNARAEDDNGTTTLLRILHYVPNKAAAGAVGTIYIAIALGLFTRLIRHRAWWGLCLPIGALVMGVGLFVRIITANNQNSEGLYIIQQLMIVLSPASFLAYNYILFGKFTARCVGPHHAAISARKFGRVFVTSDIITFLIQGGGGALQTSHNVSTGNMGAHVFLIGLALQTVSYVVFLGMVISAHRSIKKSGESTGQEEWWKVIKLIYFSSAFILVRCAYRLVEGGEGNGGFLLTHEVYFYVFDIHPLAWAIGVYIFFWPSDYLKHDWHAQQTNTYPMAQERSLA